jgi:polyisoprenoid-binding protein YceI
VKRRASVTLAVLIVAALVLASRPAHAADVTWSVSKGDVRVSCWLTVGGSFEASSSALSGHLTATSFGPAVLKGTLSVDLKTMDSGIGLRTEHLRDKYLEVGKGAGYDKAELSDIRLTDVKDESFQGRTPFTGTLLLHGVKKPVAGEAEIHHDGRTLRVNASFPITLEDHEIPEPRYLGIGVKEKVHVRVSFVAAAEGASR